MDDDEIKPPSDDELNEYDVDEYYDEDEPPPPPDDEMDEEDEIEEM